MPFVIELNNGRLWKNGPQRGGNPANSPAVVGTRENAAATIAGFSGAGALARPVVREIVGPLTAGSRFHSGYWIEGAHDGN